jgi:glucoamylase
MDYAQSLIADGKTDYVVTKMYHADIAEASGIKFDLEYVAHHWQDNTFDLWEEVSASHFFTMMVQRKAMIKGAALASMLGDQTAADFYEQQVKDMSAALEKFYDSCKNNVMPSRDYGGSGTAANKEDMDVAVYLGALYGGMDGFSFSATDERVLASVKHIGDVFDQEYVINQKDDAKMPGRLFGRYPNDVYNGNGMSQGNPWVLSTAAAAEVHYANGNSHLEYLRAGKLLYVTYASKQFYLDLVPLIDPKSRDVLQKRFQTLPDPSCDVNSEFLRLSGGDTPSVVVAGDELLHLGRALMARGDEIMARLMTHVPADNMLTEQINRNDGYLQGAQHLTWSYATVLAAMRTRNLYM